LQFTVETRQSWTGKHCNTGPYPGWPSGLASKNIHSLTPCLHGRYTTSL